MTIEEKVDQISNHFGEDSVLSWEWTLGDVPLTDKIARDSCVAITETERVIKAIYEHQSDIDCLTSAYPWIRKCREYMIRKGYIRSNTRL